jgi:hypothetical protein
MESRGWLRPYVSRLRNVACAIGLAAGCLLVLLLCAGRGAPALSASSGSGMDAAHSRVWAGTGSDLGPTWTSTQPVTTEVDKEPYVWAITQHGVTVTFYRGSVRGAAWFTFTPKSKATLPHGYLSTPYVFDLKGTFKSTDWDVSLWPPGIQIELKYDPSQLGQIEPRTLQFFHLGTIEWNPHGGDVDLAARTLTTRTMRTESFAVGGRPPQKYVHLPLVIR